MSKPIKWVGSAKEDLSAFPGDAKQVAGYQLFQLQNGFNPDNFSPTPDIGNGACEIRVQIGEDFRVIYVAKWEDAIYVLHAFHKKSNKMASRDVALAKQRYKDAKASSAAAVARRTQK
jgi:phage-related protein